MLARHIVLFFLIIWQAGLMAQEVHFHVVEKDKEDAVPGALIVFNSNEHQMTDWKGEAVAVIKGSSSITIKMLGYQEVYWPKEEWSAKLEKRTDGHFNLFVALSPIANESSTLVVSSSLYGRSIRENSQSIERIDGRDVMRKRTTDLSAALERVPGVTIVDGQASFRGGSGYSYGAGSRVLLVLDDVPLLTADRNDIKWNYIPIEMLDAMEVVKGASSVQYGSAALNGVVNVRTVVPTSAPSGMVQYYYTGFDEPGVQGAKWWGSADTSKSGKLPYQTGYLFRYGQQSGNCKWMIGGAVHAANGWIRGEDERRQRWSFKTKWKLPKWKNTQWGVNGLVMRQRLSSSLFWQNDSTGAFLGGNAMATYNDLWMNIDPWLEHVDRKGNLHSFRGRYYSSFTPNGTGFNQGVQLNQLTYRWIHHTSWGLEWLVGANINGFKFNNVDFGGDHQGAMGGVFTQGDWGWRKWHFSSGMRVEQYSIEGLHPQAIPVGRWGTTFTLNPHHTLRASYVQGYRFPSPAERFVRYTIDQINIYPNSSVVPEQGWNAELGHKAIWEKEELQVTWDNALFLTRYRNLIEFTFGRWGAITDTLFGLGYKSVNVADAQIGGWETSTNVNGKYRGWEWHGLGGYTYLLPVDLSQYAGGKNIGAYGKSLLSEFASEDTASYILRYRFKHMAKFNLDVSKGKWGAGIGWRYYSFMQKVDPVLEWFIPGLSHYRATQNHGTHICDARLFYHVSEQLSCSIQVQNIFNAFYSTRPARPDAPRNLSVQFTWKI